MISLLGRSNLSISSLGGKRARDSDLNQHVLPVEDIRFSKRPIMLAFGRENLLSSLFLENESNVMKVSNNEGVKKSPALTRASE